VGRVVTLKEVEDVLRSFAMSQRPWPDGWPVEFYLGFFRFWDMTWSKWLRKFGLEV